MRSWLGLILLLFVGGNSMAQEWSDKAHYDAYMKGDWKKVVELGKLAKKAKADYYYVRVRNGYANFMLGKFLKAESEFEKALKFNSSDAFAKRYSYWSSAYAGNSSTALVKTSKMTEAEKDNFEVVKPKWLSSVSALGGYRSSTSENVVGNMPYVSGYLTHQIGNRITLRHGVNYLNQTRIGFINALSTEVWQVGYLASLNIQVAEHTTVTPSFLMQYWEAGESKVYDLSATVGVKQQFGNLSATLIGGYYQDTDTNKYMVGGSLAFYPLNNLKLYSITSGGYNIGGNSPNPFLRQTIGGNLFKRAWLSSSFTWNNRVIAFEDIGVDFANNSSDRLNWMWSLTPTYFPIEKLGVSATYSIESRSFYLPPEGPRPGVSQKYNFHSFYLGLNYKF
jgi:tetratricopeptide (TPR) repeat protein